MRNIRRRRPAQLPPVPALTDTMILPSNVRRVYHQMSQLGSVQVGRSDNWVLGTDTADGGLRVFFTRRGELTSLQAVRDGKDISNAVNGDLTRAIVILSPTPQEKKSA